MIGIYSASGVWCGVVCCVLCVVCVVCCVLCVLCVVCCVLVCVEGLCLMWFGTSGRFTTIVLEVVLVEVRRDLLSILVNDDVDGWEDLVFCCCTGLFIPYSWCGGLHLWSFWFLGEMLHLHSGSRTW